MLERFLKIAAFVLTITITFPLLFMFNVFTFLILLLLRLLNKVVKSSFLSALEKAGVSMIKGSYYFAVIAVKEFIRVVRPRKALTATKQ